ncbi:MAG: tRNA pseudouridine(55) synthase TruB [Actinomycetota bacterium]
MTDGLVLVDKPAGLTSHDVVARLRRHCRTRKVGHAGTLDPMATGLLVVGVGRATRLLTHLVGARKTYLATVRLGQATLTDDAEGEVTARAGVHDGLPLLDEGLAGLRGDILQVPSSVSAIKVGGQRSYARVRAGEEVRLQARPVSVHRLDVTGREEAVAEDGTAVVDLDIIVECSSGTYVRALARDLGEALGVGGHLTALRRTTVGPFDVGQARTLDEIADQSVDGAPPLMTMTEAAVRCFATLQLDDAATAALRVGRPLAPAPGAGLHAALAPDGHLVGLVQNRDGEARAVLVVDPA